MWTLNSGEIATPSEFSEEFDVLGNDNQTLAGTRRRAIHAIKRNISVQWKYLTNSQYVTIRDAYLSQDPNSIYYTGEPLTLDVTDGELNISNMSVFMDIEDHTVLAGTDYLSTLEVTFIEV